MCSAAILYFCEIQQNFRNFQAVLSGTTSRGKKLYSHIFGGLEVRYNSKKKKIIKSVNLKIFFQCLSLPLRGKRQVVTC